jgi:hypothetical protein
MAFNVAARNLDDHPKRIGFLKGPDGTWRLSPAYDVIYAHNPSGVWTNQRQMTIRGKREGLTREDLLAVASEMNVKQPVKLLDEVVGAVARWRESAKGAGVPPPTRRRNPTRTPAPLKARRRRRWQSAVSRVEGGAPSRRASLSEGLHGDAAEVQKWLREFSVTPHVPKIPHPPASPRNLRLLGVEEALSEGPSQQLVGAEVDGTLPRVTDSRR